MRMRIAVVVLGAAALPLLLGQGCPTDTSTIGGGGEPSGSADDLTSLEKQAIVAGSNAPGALAQATDVTRNSTNDLSGDNEQTLPKDVTFGTCPQVTNTGSLVDLTGSVTLTIDFGSEPCTALVVQQADDDLFAYQCSGSAAGTFSRTETSIGLTFNDISCNDQALTGTVNLNYELLVPGVELEGSWDLTWYPGPDAIGTRGSGKGSYVPLAGGYDVTRIDEFTGNVTEGEYEWSITMADIRLSLEKYYSFVPYSGSTTLDGPDIRALTITFSENSPTTGEVTVSMENGPSFTVTLYELDEWADMVLGEYE